MICVPICDFCGCPIGPASNVNYVSCAGCVFHIGCFEEYKNNNNERVKGALGMEF
jgi:hypothetical protein